MRRTFMYAVIAVLAGCGSGAGQVGETTAAQVVEGSTEATYDPVLLAPACGAPVAECTSGALLAARGTGEQHSPNTILSSCQDTPYYTAGASTTVEAIRVRSLDGLPLQVGRVAEIQVDVFAVDPSLDRLYVFHAADSGDAQWSFVGEAHPPGPVGARTYSFRFTLPEGGSQAVRASFRRDIKTAPYFCDSRGEGDIDDLAFAVAPGTPDAVPPTVAIVAPAEGANVSGLVSLEASAADDVYLRTVRFVHGVQTIAQVDAPPYVASWNTTMLSAGTHAVTVEAIDGAGNVASSTVTVTVLDIARPYVEVVSPEMGAPVAGVVPVTANVADANGVVDAELWIGLPSMEHANTLVASVPASNGTVTIPWDTAGLPAGRYYLEVRAHDAAGNVGASNPIMFVDVDNDPPEVAITSPATGTVVKGRVTIAATMTDLRPRQVDLYVDGALLASVASPGPYVAEWDSRKNPGAHVFTAVASDWAGNTTTSAPVTVQVR